MIPLKDVNPTRRPAVLTIGLIVACALVFAFQSVEAGRRLPAEPPGLHLRVRARGRPPRERRRPAADACQQLNQRQDRLTGPRHEPVPARRRAPHRLQHAVPVGLRQQHRGPAGPRALPALLPAVRRRRRAWPRRSSTPTSAVPLIGASGAISGVLGAYLVLYPAGAHLDRRAALLLPPVPPARPGSGWPSTSPCSSSTWAARRPPAATGVAYMAHIGGFVAGAALITPLPGRAPRAAPALPRRGARVLSLFRRRRRPRRAEPEPWVKVAFARHQPEAEMLAGLLARARDPGAHAARDASTCPTCWPAARASCSCRPPGARGARPARPDGAARVSGARPRPGAP